MQSQQKKAVIVGATGNLGSAVAQALESAGWWVDPTWNTKDHPDAREAQAYKSLPDRIDLAVYIAGVNLVKPTEELAEEEWDRIIDTNLKGAFLFARAAFPALKAAGTSTFVVISSINSMHPYPKRLPYAVSKAGLEAMARALAVEWGEYGIATQAIRLGHLEGLMKTTNINPAFLEAVKERTPSHTLIDPKAVASYIMWLAEGGAQSVSGGVMDFDPAYTINRWPL